MIRRALERVKTFRLRETFLERIFPFREKVDGVDENQTGELRDDLRQPRFQGP